MKEIETNSSKESLDREIKEAKSDISFAYGIIALSAVALAGAAGIVVGENEVAKKVAPLLCLTANIGIPSAAIILITGRRKLETLNKEKSFIVDNNNPAQQ